ncbi:MAG: hypothetical protein U9Q06_04160 [Nanoarchaeota archaeon]|nr:hypothetical protein [Nanoarchaeota archaeon]
MKQHRDSGRKQSRSEITNFLNSRNYGLAETFVENYENKFGSDLWSRGIDSRIQKAYEKIDEIDEVQTKFAV